MNYLLINHVPFGRGSAAGLYRVGDLFFQDLCAQARAIRKAGGKLIVAVPCVANLDSMVGGSFSTVEIEPSAHGFEYVALPFFLSVREYLRVGLALRAELRQAIARCDIVQMDYGGYPVMLGEVAWPIATALAKKRIWVFDGADPFPRMELEAANEPNLIKRAVKTFSARLKSNFCEIAIREADLVFSHNLAVVERFAAIWTNHCHAFNRSFVTEEILITDSQLDERKQRLRDSGRPLHLMAAGRQIRIKGTDQAIRAVAKLRDQGVAVQLTVMGDGEDMDEFRRLAVALDATDIVHFAGSVPYGSQLFDAWAEADIMLVTNLTAEISRNVLLGLARGLPLVTYENPGTDTLLRAGRAASIVPKGDVDQLVQAIAAMNCDRAHLADLAERGLQLARANTLDATHQRRADLAAGLLRA